MAFISEKKATIDCINHARTWGYGNMIDRLKTAWLHHLLFTTPDLTVKAAALGARFDEERAKQFEEAGREAVMKYCDEYAFIDESF